jgi:hypothetical protein
MTENKDSTRDNAAASNLLDRILSVDVAVFGGELASLDDRSFHLLSQRFKVCNDIVQNEEYSRLAIHQEGSSPIPVPIPINPSSSVLPPEALRQAMRSGFLTVQELGRLLLLTCKSFIQVIGHEHVYRHLCHTRWPNTDSVPTSLIEARGYQWLFYHRLGRILLQPKEGELQLCPLTPPTISSRDLQFYISISNGPKEIISEVIVSPEQVHELLTQATVTIDLQHPVHVASLPDNRCHCWNLPETDAYQDWSATVHLLHLGNNNHANANSSSCHCLLDTGFCSWRGWSQVGELVFMQNERTRGLELTDRGKYIEHRIVRTSNTSTTQQREMSMSNTNWQGYLGLQFKMVLLCSSAATAGTSSVVDMNMDEHPAMTQVPFEFQKLKLEAIRVHENSQGNIQHNLFRNDVGWQRHGVELAHLLEELVG